MNLYEKKVNWCCVSRWNEEEIEIGSDGEGEEKMMTILFIGDFFGKDFFRRYEYKQEQNGDTVQESQRTPRTD